MKRLVRVGITQGDYNGVGPEVIAGILSDAGMLELMTPVVFADWRVMEQAFLQVAGEMPPQCRRVVSSSDAQEGCVNIVDLRLDSCRINPGKPDKDSGAGAVAALDAAMDAIESGDVDVIVTAPISKEAAQSDTFRYNGHTEYLGARAGNGSVPQMILFDDKIRVALVTTHLPLSEVSSAVTKEKVKEGIVSFSSTLRKDFGLTRPKIAVLSLNPHCGDGGLLGHEEEDVIRPAIEECNDEGYLAFGPYAADGFFGSGAYGRFDGVLAMYHDQGLAAFKALARAEGVNFTAGLPFVRTSPDHGTACDIAWQGLADPTSMREAVYHAIDIYRTRQRHLQATANPLRHQAPERDRKDDRPRRPAAAEREDAKEGPRQQENQQENQESK